VDDSSVPARADVVVVGAGLAGLACARRITAASADLHVAVLEAGDGVGGRVRTDVVDGFRVDRGFQLLNPSYPEARRVLDLRDLRMRPLPAGVVVATGDRRRLLADPRRSPPSTVPRSLAAVLAIGGVREVPAFARWALRSGYARTGDLLAAPDEPWGEALDRLGIDGPLRSAVLATFLAGTLAEPQVSGDLRTQRGTLDVLGKRLELTRGILRWDQGGVVPSLDILATARTSTHAITVALTGLANAPEVQLGSSPDLPPDEVVARLLFDRPTSGLSPFEIIQIAQAVGQLAGVEPPGGGVDGVLGRVRRFLGLDRLNAGGDARGGAAVQAGNYIAPGVYLGLQSGSTGTGLGVQAEIAPGLKLEGSAGTSAGRLGLTFEREW